MRRQWVYLLLGAWMVACVSLFVMLWSYANVAGTQGMLPMGWSPAAQLETPDDRPMLLMFAHPKCPCTRATMSAIERLQRDVPGAFATRVVFYEPDAADLTWRETDLWARAEKLIDAKAIADPGGLMTSEAGAVVSGSVALFDRDGGLQFWGGLTPSRGHEGESVGLSAVRSILRGQEPGQVRAPAFGCEIVGTIECQLDRCGGEGCDAGMDI